MTANRVQAVSPLERLREMAMDDAELAAHFPDEAVSRALREPGLLLPQMISRLLAGYADRPGFGSRAYELVERGGRTERRHLPRFDRITYGEVARQIEAIASAWRQDPRYRVAPGDFACFLGFVSAELAIIDFASTYAGAIAVPLQANLPEADMLEVFGDTAPTVLVTALENLDLATAMALRVPSLRSLVVIDVDERVDDEREAIAAARARLVDAGGKITLATFAELVAAGSGYRFEHLPPSPEGQDTIRLLIYTSGSTGTPKGAMMHDANLCEPFVFAHAMPGVSLAYAPLNHFLGRNIVHYTMGVGGIVDFTLKSDLSTFFEDARISRPTFMLFMPRIIDIMFQQYRAEVQKRVAAGEDREAADAAVRAGMSRTVVGDRLVAGGVGGAPTSAEVRDFVRECLGIQFSDGYSCTEGSSIGMVGGGRVLRDVITDYKLVDVPELGYYTTDRPWPRGELLVKSRLAFKGYFKRPEATAKVLDAEGWLHTGDVFEERGPDEVYWLDRRNNVIKLAQAEYVAIGPLEAAYLGHCRLIRQIYVYGNSRRSYLLAVVVPHIEAIALRLGAEPTVEDMRRLVLADMQDAARLAGLKAFEVPRDVVIETAPFTFENGLLSSVQKPLRPKLRDRYQARLEAIYSAMDRQQEAELEALRENAGGASVLERVAGALKASLGLAEVDPRSAQSFGDLGGDSLGAASFALLLEEVFGVEVPVGVILSPTASAARLADFIERALAEGGAVATFASVHGEGATTLRTADLTLDAFLDAGALAAAEAAAPASAGPDRTVLVTGATGFLGRFLCLEWLEAMAASGGPSDGKVIALVRAADDAQARARLDDAYGTLDAALAADWRRLAAAGRLEVVAGDLAQPRLGLAPAVWQRLAGEVDRIVHPGALVNHLLSYRNLFEPNVRGTAELIRLALDGRAKRFDYVSTFGVPKLTPFMLAQKEDFDVRGGIGEIGLSDEYAAGYAISKFAGEVLLREAHARFALPVTVFRPDMIMPHSGYAGQVNLPDMLTRLLLSVALTGLAPQSFYPPTADGRRARTHFDGIPVDFLARSIQRIGAAGDGGFATFNTISSHRDDGISLDSFVDWIASAGYPVRRIANHGDWLDRFATALRALPEPRRSGTALPTLGFVARPHAVDAAKVENTAFVAAIGGFARDVPALDEAYIHKYLADLRLLGLLETVAGGGSAPITGSSRQPSPVRP